MEDIQQNRINRKVLMKEKNRNKYDVDSRSKRNKSYQRQELRDMKQGDSSMKSQWWLGKY